MADYTAEQIAKVARGVGLEQYLVMYEGFLVDNRKSRDVGDYLLTECQWNPLTNPADAWELYELLCTRGLFPDFDMTVDGKPQFTLPKLGPDGRNWIGYRGAGDSMREALFAAALQVVEAGE